MAGQRCGHTCIDAIRCLKYSSDATYVLPYQTLPASLLAIINEGCLLVWRFQSDIYLSVKLASSASLIVVISRTVNQVSSDCLVLPMSHMRVSCRQLGQHEVGHIPASRLVLDRLTTMSSGSKRSELAPETDVADVAIAAMSRSRRLTILFDSC